jgi:hypothetical protein
MIKGPLPRCLTLVPLAPDHDSDESGMTELSRYLYALAGEYRELADHLRSCGHVTLPHRLLQNATKLQRSGDMVATLAHGNVAMPRYSH